MTLANLLTVARICLIPIFAYVASSYCGTFYSGHPDERLRLISIIIFVVAAATDGIDGFIARRLNQRTRLGAILDPLADKGLVFTALIVLASGIWSPGFSVWFPILVISRDVILITGFLTLSAISIPLTVKPSIFGKLATVFQLISIIWALSGFRMISVLFAVIPAAALTLYSGIGYVIDGIQQTRAFKSRAAK